LADSPPVGGAEHPTAEHRDTDHDVEKVVFVKDSDRSADLYFLVVVLSVSCKVLTLYG
jgi:hypothetical protein